MAVILRLHLVLMSQLLVVVEVVLETLQKIPELAVVSAEFMMEIVMMEAAMEALAAPIPITMVAQVAAVLEDIQDRAATGPVRQEVVVVKAVAMAPAAAVVEVVKVAQMNSAVAVVVA